MLMTSSVVVVIKKYTPTPDDTKTKWENMSNKSQDVKIFVEQSQHIILKGKPIDTNYLVIPIGFTDLFFLLSITWF